MGRVLLGGELGAKAELFQHDGQAEAPGELAGDGRRHVLADVVVRHEVDVGAGKIDDRSESAEGIAIVVAGDFDTPGAVSQRDRLTDPGGADALDDQPGPGGDFRDGGRAAVYRHFVGHEPTHDRRVAPEPLGYFRGEPGLFGHHPDVPVQVPAVAPRWVPVFAGHVAHDEGGDRPEPRLRMGVEKIAEPLQHLIVELARSRLEVRPVTERTGDIAAVGSEHGELLAHNSSVVARPHAGTPSAGPEVGPDPGRTIPGLYHATPPFSHPTPSPSDGRRTPASLPRGALKTSSAQ